MVDAAFIALDRQSGIPRGEWPLAAKESAHLFARRLFRNTNPPIAIALIVLGYLDRLKHSLAFEREDLACERLLLGLFVVGYKVCYLVAYASTFFDVGLVRPRLARPRMGVRQFHLYSRGCAIY